MTKASIMTADARLARARGILADSEGQSKARLRRACRTILDYADVSETTERAAAAKLLRELEPETHRQRRGFTGGV